MSLGRKIYTTALGMAGTAAGALLLWAAATIWATKADAAQLGELAGRVDALTEMRTMILQRLDRIEHKLDEMNSRK